MCDSVSASGRRIRKARRNEDRSKPDNIGPLEKLALRSFAGSQIEVMRHYYLYKCLWTRTSCHANQLCHKLYTDLTKRICDFLMNSVESEGSNFKHLIPVASLTTGLSGDEHTQIFNLIIRKIRNACKTHSITRINPKTKPSLKLILHSIKEQFKNCHLDISEGSTTSKPKVRPIVVIIENLELMNLSLVQNLLRVICFRQSQKQHLPFFLVFGSSCGAFPWCNIVPVEVESSYIHNEFSAPLPRDLFNLFCDVVLDFRIPIKLSGNVIRFLKDYFNRTEFSFSKLLQAYQLCLMKKFQTLQNDYPICLALGLNQENKEFKYLLESVPEPDMMYQTSLEKYTNNLLKWYKALCFTYGLTKVLIGQSGFYFSDMYLLPWNDTFFGRNEKVGDSFTYYFDDFVSSSDKWVSSIGDLEKFQNMIHKQANKIHVNIVEDSTESKVDAALSGLKRLVKSKGVLESNGVRQNSDPTACLKGKSIRLADMRRAREAFCQQKAPNKVADELRTYLKNLKSELKLFCSMDDKLKDVFVCDDVVTLQRYFSTSIEQSLHSCLTEINSFELNKYDYQPDTAILYGILLERPTLNVHIDDLYPPFELKLEDPLNDQPKRKRKIDRLKLCRFKQAVVELQMLGFLKRSKRNPDEFARQIWPI